MSTTRKLQAPKITPPTLTGLTAADADMARSGEGVDGLSISNADLSDLRLDSVTWVESELTGATMRNTRLPGCRFLDVRLDRLDALDLVAPGAKWRDSEIVSSRLGAVGLYDATIDSLRITGSKIGFLNLRNCVISDLVVEDCPIEELDLSDATLTRASFSGCTIDTLTLRNATLKDVDLRGARLGAIAPVVGLRGAVIDHHQLIDIAPVLADGLGLVVE